MAETLSPKPSAVQNQKIPIANRLQSPITPFFLGSNNDQLERAQARAARAAAIRRKSLLGTAPPPPSASQLGLDKDQIAELFQNCIKLASENKINQKNTWELKLIDHLSEIINVQGDDDTETNFQKASCTLEAGVKIYSLRVDSVHSEAYKVLSRINQVTREDEQETTTEGDSKNGQTGGHKKESERKISPLSTVESSFEVLNVKKFDVAFAVDPLYHQTSAQFDEGGAKGLLLNNLGVYGGCQVLFDSLEMPGKDRSFFIQNDSSDTIDLSFAQEYIEKMMMNVSVMNEISPTLREIISLFDEDNQRPSQNINVSQKFDGRPDDFDDSEAELDGNLFGNIEAGTFDHGDETSVRDESSSFGGPTFQSYPEENDPDTFFQADVDDRFEKFADYLFQGLGFVSKQNAWAGPNHWKYQRSKGSEDAPSTEYESALRSKRKKNKNVAEVDIDFTSSLDKEMLDIFAPPKSAKSILLPENRVPCDNILPEDRHYQSMDLLKLFLLPNVLCLGNRRRKFSDNSWQKNNDFDEPLPSWDNEHVFGGEYGDGCVHSDAEDPNSLVSQPCQVNKIEVEYDKTSKQVDVHVLKEVLWNHIQKSFKIPTSGCKDKTSFKQLLATFPYGCQAAASENISPHLCFICLLHLANEHSLTIHDCPSLDDLTIRLPQVIQASS